MAGASSLSAKLWSTIVGYEILDHEQATTCGCPVCGRPEFLVWPDEDDGAGWSWCRHCDTSGDMIQIAESVWKCDTRQAEIGLKALLAQLSAAPDFLPSLLLRRAWRQELAAVTASMRNGDHLVLSDGRTLFGGDARDPEAGFVVTKEALSLGLSQLGLSHPGLRTGKVGLVTPLCRVPRLLNGWHVTTRAETSTAPISFSSRWGQPSAVGIAGLANALRATTPGAPLVMLLSPARVNDWTARWQTSLPLVGAAAAGETRNGISPAWAVHRRVCVYDTELRAVAVRVARAENLEVSRYVGSLPSAATQFSPWFRAVLAHKTDWQSAVVATIRNMTAAQALGFGQQIRLLARDYTALLPRLPVPLATGLRALMVTVGRVAELNVTLNGPVRLTSAGLVDNSGVRFPGWVELATVITSEDCRQHLAIVGEFVTGDNRVPVKWQGSLKRAHRLSAAEWLRRTLPSVDRLQAKLIGEGFDKLSLEALLTVAAAIPGKTPEYVQGCSRVGWCRLARQLRFPQFAINHEGRTVKKVFIGRRRSPLHWLPADYVDTAALELLESNPSAFNLLAVLLLPVFCDMANRQFPRFVVYGEGIESTMQLVGVSRAKPNRHRWPTVTTSRAQGFACVQIASSWLEACLLQQEQVAAVKIELTAAETKSVASAVPAVVRQVLKNCDPLPWTLEELRPVVNAWCESLGGRLAPQQPATPLNHLDRLILSCQMCKSTDGDPVTYIDEQGQFCVDVVTLADRLSEKFGRRVPVSAFSKPDSEEFHTFDRGLRIAYKAWVALRQNNIQLFQKD